MFGTLHWTPITSVWCIVHLLGLRILVIHPVLVHVLCVIVAFELIPTYVGIVLALIPPALPKFTVRFRHIIRLLNCDLTISIMQLILARSTAKYSKSWSEAQLEMVNIHIYTIIKLFECLRKYAFEVSVVEFH